MLKMTVNIFTHVDLQKKAVIFCSAAAMLIDSFKLFNVILVFD